MCNIECAKSGHVANIEFHTKVNMEVVILFGNSYQYHVTTNNGSNVTYQLPS